MTAHAKRRDDAPCATIPALGGLFVSRHLWSIVISVCVVSSVRPAGAAALRPALLLDVRESAEAPERIARWPLPELPRCASSTRCEKNAHVLSPDGALELQITVKGSSELFVEAIWRRPVWAARVAVELSWPGDTAEVFGRDLRPISTNYAHLDRFDPKWITVRARGLPVRRLLVDDGVDGVEVANQPATQRVLVRLELFSAESRPFVHDARCAHNWRDKNRRVKMGARFFRAGDRLRAHVQLYDEAHDPVVKAHFPDGRRAALVITDHADQSTKATLTALAFGRSDATASAPRGGLFGHHLSITKALFAHGGKRPQLEGGAMKELASLLSRAGWEIVPHSATPLRDDRGLTEQALKLFSRFSARSWIDHQPETNCEAFNDEGYRTQGRFGIADLLGSHGYQYIWAEGDAPAGELNLLHPARIAEPAATIWPLGRLEPDGPGTFWLFRSTWAFLEATRFYASLSRSKLDALEQERGLAILHTYLETLHPRNTRFGRRNLLVTLNAHGRAPVVALDRRFEQLLAALESRVERGTLWMPTIGTLADRLRALSDVTFSFEGTHAVLVHSASAIEGATFAAPGHLSPTLKGMPNQTLAVQTPKGIRYEDGLTWFWFDLPAGDSTIQLGSPSADSTSPR
jgi:hypothetical protein